MTREGVVVRRSARARRVTLRFTGTQVELVLPLRAPEKIVGEVLASHREWIDRALGRALETQAQAHRLRWGGDERTVVFGSGAARWEGDGVVAATPLALENFLRQEAGARLIPMTQEWARRMEVQPTAIVVKAQKARWGTCSSRGEVRLNWRLGMFEERVQRSVVIHELAHLKELNHSARFWAIVRAFDPDWAETDRILKRDGHAALAWEAGGAFLA